MGILENAQQVFANFGEAMQKFYESIVANLGNIVEAVIGIILVLLAVKVINALAKRIIKKSIAKKIAKNPNSLAAKKSETLASMLTSVVRYVVYFFAIAAILGILGLSATVGSLLATAGIGGVALGLGAQAFVKDVVAGVLMLFEDQYAVGDYITAGQFTGTVESISLRTTRLRLTNNEIATIPNGLIDTVVNYTRDNYTLFFDVDIAYETDIGEAQRIMLEVGKQYAETSKNVVSGPMPVGAVAITPKRVTLRMSFSVAPLSQWQVERELNAAVAQAFKEHNISQPDFSNFVEVKNGK